MLSLLLIGLCLCYQWQRYSRHNEQLQAAMLPFADEPEQACRIELETGLPCLPERLERQITLSG